jgi:hypothetical protein
MKRLVLSITIVVLFLVLLFMLCQKAGWAADLSCGEGCVYLAEEPNEPNEPVPEPEVYGFSYILMNEGEEPNDPNVPEPEVCGFCYMMISQGEEPNEPNEPEPESI